MESTQLHVGDIGTALTLPVQESGVALDISAATGLTFYLVGTNGAVKTRTAIFDSDGTDGRLKYLTIADDLDQEGRWVLQAGFTLGGWTGRTLPVRFDVGKQY